MNLRSLFTNLFKVGADQENNLRHEFDDFCEHNLSRQEMAILNEIYSWWFAPKSEGGLGKKKNDFVTLMMGYKDHLLDELKLMIRAWASGDRRYVELKLYKLEPDRLEQDVKNNIVDPILKPLNEMISADLRKKRERRNLKMPVKPGRRFF